MKVRIFQIALDKDKRNLMFMNYDFTVAHGGVREEEYEKVFDDELKVNRLDLIYQMFNTSLPDSYTGRRMSVSDIVYAEGLGTFFCDSYGWKQLKNFNQDKCPDGGVR